VLVPVREDAHQPTGNHGRARPICESCRVRLTCLEEALAYEGRATVAERAGMFGALSPRTEAAVRPGAPTRLGAAAVADRRR
jgi:Transcription factor WhiB